MLIENLILYFQVVGTFWRNHQRAPTEQQIPERSSVALDASGTQAGSTTTAAAQKALCNAI